MMRAGSREDDAVQSDKRALAGLSLEEELAEATQDLLDLHQAGQHTRVPSPLFSISSPASADTQIAQRNAQSASTEGHRLNVSQALGIDQGARLTPVNDDETSPRRQWQESQGAEKDIPAPKPSKAPIDLRYPSSQLHHTAAPVGALHAPPSHRSTPKSPVSPQMEAVERELQEWFGSSRPSSAAAKRQEDPRKSKQMEALQSRLAGARSRNRSSPAPETLREDGEASAMPSAVSSGGDHRASGSRAPAFFLQSFPDAVGYLEHYPVEKASESSSSSSVSQDDAQNAGDASRPFSQAENDEATDQERKGKGRHIDQSGPQMLLLSDSRLSQARDSYYDGISEVTVKLHGNRRLERQAQQDEEEAQARADGAEVGNETLVELAPAPKRRGSADTTSLLSLAATADTASSSDKGRRRRHSVGRRRSAGSYSQLTTGSGSGSAGRLRESSDIHSLDYGPALPFTRDVSIRGFSIVGAKARGYVAYDVRVTLQTGTTVSLPRRFSSFVALRRALVLECGDGTTKAKKKSLLSSPDTTRAERDTRQASPRTPAVRLPQLPPRRAGLLHKYAAHHLETRRLALQRWLYVVMLDRVYGTCKALRQWVVGPDEELDEQDAS